MALYDVRLFVCQSIFMSKKDMNSDFSIGCT